MGVWEQIHESRQIHFKEEDTFDEHQHNDADDDEDLVLQTRSKKIDKGFGYSSNNRYPEKSPVARGDHELNNILESRNQQMKVDLQNARLQINRNPVKVSKPEDEEVKEDHDDDLAETLKFKKEDQGAKATRQYELKTIDGDDDFGGMDVAPMKKEPPPLQVNRPPLIPIAKNRVKLQPMNMGPVL